MQDFFPYKTLLNFRVKNYLLENLELNMSDHPCIRDLSCNEKEKTFSIHDVAQFDLHKYILVC